MSSERVMWLTLTEGTSIAVPMQEALAMTEREFAQLYRKHLYGVSRSAAREWAREQVRLRAAATAAGGGTDG